MAGDGAQESVGASFFWVRGNTPVNALFALDPLYMDLPGEDDNRLPQPGRREAGWPTQSRIAARSACFLPWQMMVDPGAGEGLEELSGTDFSRLKHNYGVGLGGLAAAGRCEILIALIRMGRCESAGLP